MIDMMVHMLIHVMARENLDNLKKILKIVKSVWI